MSEVVYEKDNLVQELELLLSRRVKQDALTISALPSSVARCLEVLRQPEYETRELVQIVETDVALAARITRLASSVAAGPGAMQPTMSLSAAMNRMGTRKVRSVLLESAVEKLFVSKDQNIADATLAAWKHSRAVAIIARDLRALAGGGDSEEAYLVGLLHDIGKPLVVAMLLDAERQISELRGRPWVDAKRWKRVLRALHRKVGVMVVEKWHLSPDIVKSVRDCDDFDASDRGSLANLVCFANALSKTSGLAGDIEEAEVEDAKALVLIGSSMLALDETLVKGVAGTIKARIEGMSLAA
jgi:putative nucleotidyltransferase with HDIG domain